MPAACAGNDTEQELDRSPHNGSKMVPLRVWPAGKTTSNSATSPLNSFVVVGHLLRVSVPFVAHRGVPTSGHEEANVSVYAAAQIRAE
jgi:hypothetical protein